MMVTGGVDAALGNSALVGLPVGTPGELCTRGYAVMLGYWEDDERTNQAIDRAGWMHTGDLATIDAEGYCAIGGRITTKLDFGGIGILTPEAHAFWQHEYLDAQTQVTAAFVGAPSGQFVTLSSNFGRDSGLAGVAISSDPNSPFRLSLTYDAQFNGTFTNQIVSLGFRTKF